MRTPTRFTLAITVGLALAVEAPAQFLPPPVVGLPILIPNGIDFRFKAGGLRVNGFIPTGGATSLVLPVIPGGAPPGMIFPATYYPYSPYYLAQYPGPLLGTVDQRYNLTIINPPGLSPRVGRIPFPDVSGIDLDKEPPSKIWGEKPGLAKAPPVKNEIAKVDKPAPKVQVANQAKVAPPAPPKLEGDRFLDLGVAAFKNGEYGLAIRWFREASDADRAPQRAVFYLAQAYLAVGKYREAAALLRDSVDAQPRWPFHAFSPKADLYDNDFLEFNAHRKQLEEALKAMPKDGDYLFLLGYWCWFDGDRDGAIDFFQQSRAVAADPTASDLFLRAAKKK